VECRILSARIPALLALVDTAYGPAVAEETREETRGESLPPFACLQPTIDASRMARVASRQNRGYCHACLHLRVEAAAAPRIVGRRFVPPAISTQDRRQDVSDPGSGTRRGPGPRPGGSLTSWLAVWQLPTLPFGEERVVPIAGCRRTHASPAAPRGRHVRRQSIGETCVWTAGCLSGRNDDAARDVRRTGRAADGSRCAA
jgi:hypothetical protein